ncbi:MAG: RHS repeat-associated core domain-containing protein [Bacteroidales bacterium]|nr:RHS repeat-associated core domain-containing protein [Bacteroidales bacterium]
METTDILPVNANTSPFPRVGEGLGLGADHLGNIRSVITTDTNQHWLAQGTDYYPFGMEIPIYGNSDNQLKYNGKELQTEAGLEWYDYGARFYDPQLGRWHSVDPMAENHYDYTPYANVYNNPITLIDPFGLDSIYYNQTGDEINRVKSDNDFFFLEHEDGNKTIGEGNYFQGLSRESFFGDRSNGEDQLFETIDNVALGSDKKIAETVDKHTKEGETWAGFGKESPETKHYDYKNTVLGPQAEIPIDNNNTAYMYKGKLLNRNEAGNVFWGATTQKLGIPGMLMSAVVQAFTLKDEGKFDERGEHTAIFLGRTIYKNENK